MIHTGYQNNTVSQSHTPDPPLLTHPSLFPLPRILHPLGLQSIAARVFLVTPRLRSAPDFSVREAALQSPLPTFPTEFTNPISNSQLSGRAMLQASTPHFHMYEPSACFVAPSCLPSPDPATPVPALCIRYPTNETPSPHPTSQTLTSLHHARSTLKLYIDRVVLRCALLCNTAQAMALVATLLCSLP